MKKLITLILLLLASVLGMVFWKPLTLAIVERQLKVWSQEELGQTLSYGKASWEDDAIVITSPALIPSIEETSSGEFRASAERLAIKCFLDFSKWKLAIHLSLLQPKIAIVKKAPEFPLPA